MCSLLSSTSRNSNSVNLDGEPGIFICNKYLRPLSRRWYGKIENRDPFIQLEALKMFSLTVVDHWRSGVLLSHLPCDLGQVT